MECIKSRCTFSDLGCNAPSLHSAFQFIKILHKHLFTSHLRCYSYLHLRDEETEAQLDKATSSRSHS